MKFFADIRMLLLAIWLGAACFFIAVAQSAFAVLPAREMAGLIVNRTLGILNVAGVVVAVTLVAMSFVGSARINRWWLLAERFLLAIMGVACAIAQLVIGFWLSATREQMGRPIDDVPIDDPLRIQFNVLHQYSEWLLIAAMLAALLTFFIISNRRFQNGGEIKPDIYDFSKEFKV